MKRERVNSSVIASVGYDARTSGMDVEFISGRVYRYFQVPPAVHDSLMSAQSIGRYFNAHIRDRFRNRELTELG
jgi:hypothetical protein